MKSNAAEKEIRTAARCLRYMRRLVRWVPFALGLVCIMVIAKGGMGVEGIILWTCALLHGAFHISPNVE